MRCALLGLITSALLASPAGANYYQFTGTISFSQSSKRFLPKGVSLSGSGVGYSQVSPSNEIRLSFVTGFMGTLSTQFASTAGYTQEAFIDGVGKGHFTRPVAGKLHGKAGVRGQARRLFLGDAYARFPLTVGSIAGLGLDGTLPASSGSTPSVRFGTWTTGRVVEPLVITQSMAAYGTFVLGAIADSGFDARTPLGKGTVQLVTPLRTVSGFPADRAAIARLTLNFAPEPSRAALLLGGCLMLALIGARRAVTA